MYTEFIIDAKFKDNTPKEILNCITDMVNDIENELFTYRRNPLDSNNGNEHPPKSFSNLHIKAHGEIKNYWSDITRFVDFIKPYIEEGFLENKAFAKSLYQEYEEWTFYSTEHNLKTNNK